jgi:hypothetical protein
MPRPALNPDEKDRRFVRTLAKLGLTDVEIAGELSLDARTLVRHFREDLDLGRAEAHAMAAIGLYRKLRKGNLRAIMFWLEYRAGWRTNSQTSSPAESL